MATMKQIAQLAGVSRGTVDRVLNNRGFVNEETARKVREIAQSLNYIPSKAARYLAALKQGLKLGYILFPNESNAFFGQVEQGIHKKAAELMEFGVTVEIEYGDFSNPARQDEILEDMANRGVKGIALCGFNTENTVNKINELAERHIPVVTANTDIPASKRLAYVGSDYIKSGRTAAALMKLIKPNGARVGIMIGSRNIDCHIERVNGFDAYILENARGIVTASVAENGDDDFESFSIVKDMLAKDPTIDALYLASAGVFGACRAVETLPEDRRPIIISYDCLPTTELMLRKGIISATICQQPDYQGSKPLDILFNYLGMDTPPNRTNYYTNIDIKISENI